MKSAPALALFLTLVSAPAFAAHADFSCNGSKLMARGTLFLAFSIASGGEGLVTGDDAYDAKLREGVNRKFTEEDSRIVLEYIQKNPKAAGAIAEKANELRAKGLRGSRFLYELVNFFLDSKNGLCQK
jgi:hypothetical protein